jgi:uncharacterized protein YecT (DUF1311 family)
LARRSSLELINVERAANARIEKWDEEANWRLASAEALKQSSRQFLKYRKSQCDLVASLAAGGNGAGDMRLNCIVRLNAQRVDELRRLMEGIK